MASSGASKGSTPQLKADVGKTETVTADTTVGSTTSTVFASSSSGAKTMTLPLAAKAEGRSIKFVKTGSSGTIVVDGNGSETINGSANFTLTAQYDSVEVTSNGTEWFVTARYLAGDFA